MEVRHKHATVLFLSYLRIKTTRIWTGRRLWCIVH